MKTPKFLLLLQLIWLPVSLLSQVQWYQNQDGTNPPPSGTFSSSAKLFTPGSFVACYQWSSSNEIYTWKISKSHINGQEQKSFFLTGTWASADIKVGRYNTLYVLLRSFPLEGNAVFIMYKLDTNLVVKTQRQIVLPNNFSIFNVNAFELDRTDNLYLAGDGQYPDGEEFSPASFILKTDKNLNVKWRRVDSTVTSFAQLLVEQDDKIMVIEDHYTFFPQIRIRKYNASGSLRSRQVLETDPNRFNLLSRLDNSGNLLLYGGMMTSDTSQAMYIYKISRHSGNIIYYKKYFEAMGIQLHDLSIDENGRMFSLVSQYMNNGDQQCMVSRINPNGGTVLWNIQYPYAADSCVLTKLVVNESDEMFVLGARRNSSYLSKGIVMRIKKSGLQEGMYNGPDSINYQLSHSLVDGITDRDGQLIAIGNTNDFDPYTYNSTYFRAFAARFGNKKGDHGCEDKNISQVMPAKNAGSIAEADEDIVASEKLVVYPNPVQNQLVVSGINMEEYDLITVYNMQGVQLLKQSFAKSGTRVDVSFLKNGMYLLTLRSSVSFKEKSVRFVVSR